MLPDRKTQHLILITCTYKRRRRIKYFDHLIWCVSKLNNYTWIIVEDGSEIDPQLNYKLKKHKLNYIYLNYGPTNKGGNLQRNLALEFIVDNHLNGIVYNMDDDNIYDPILFDEVRKTNKLSIFPVGGLQNRHICNPERPIIKNGKFIKWSSIWIRKFSTDMAGFAFNAELLQNIKYPIWEYTEHGGGETEFIEKLGIDLEKIQFDLCENCTRAYVIHNGLKHHPFINGIKILPHIVRNNKSHALGESDCSQYTLDKIKEISQKNVQNNLCHHFKQSHTNIDILEFAIIIKCLNHHKTSSNVLHIPAGSGVLSSMIASIDTNNTIYCLDSFGLCDNKLNKDLLNNFYQNTTTNKNINLIINEVDNIDFEYIFNDKLNLIFIDLQAFKINLLPILFTKIQYYLDKNSYIMINQAYNKQNISTIRNIMHTYSLRTICTLEARGGTILLKSL